jgi:hypothetical protein
MPEFDARKFAKQVTEVAERVADVSDAARGKRKRSGGLGRWLLLPAAGAAVFAVAKRALAAGRSTGGDVRGANERPETPDMDLLNRVKDVATAPPSMDTRELEEHRRERAERRRESRSTS